MHTTPTDESTIILRVLQRLEERVSEITPARLPRHVSIDDAAEMLCVSTDTVRRMLDRRELAYVQARPTAAKRIPLDALHRWIDEHTTRPIAQ